MQHSKGKHISITTFTVKDSSRWKQTQFLLVDKDEAGKKRQVSKDETGKKRQVRRDILVNRPTPRGPRVTVGFRCFQRDWKTAQGVETEG